MSLTTSIPLSLTTYASATAYFQAFPISPVRGGGEFEVFAAPHVVVKRLSTYKMGFWAMLAHAAKAAGPRELAQFGMDTARKLHQQKFEQLFEIKERGGGLVVPFEIPDEIQCTVRRLWGVWRGREVFYRPVVQRRVSRDSLLTNRLAQSRKAGDMATMGSLIDKAFGTMEELICRGFFPHDNLPDNFCLLEGAVVLLDLGAVWRIGGQVRNVLRGDEEVRRQYVDRNASVWEGAIRGTQSKGKSPQVDRLVGSFRSRFTHFNTWRTVATRRSSTRKKAPVPDVFPLSVESPPPRRWF